MAFQEPLAGAEEDVTGYFTVAGRAAATAQALPLLVTYFVQGSTITLAPGRAVDVADDDDLGGFVRMRVALAAAERLEKIAHQILRRPSFLYQRQAEESLGVLSGQLDIGRYVRTRLRHDAPRRFPVQRVVRYHATAENVLLAYGLTWVVSELAKAPLRVIPPSSPEHQSVVDYRVRLSRLSREPVLAALDGRALEVRRTRSLASLIEQVSNRLETGRIQARDAYRKLISWFEQFDPERAVAAPGIVEWAFYDERFDSKLFEVWGLKLLADSMREVLGPPVAEMRPLYERTQRSLLEWNFGSTKVRLFFQASLSSLSTNGTVRWHYIEGAVGELRGFPDLAIEIERLGASKIVVLIDPKLRQRSRAPTEEMYKLLGYFHNLALEQPAAGAIIFYTPSSHRRFELVGDDGGSLLAIGVDPVDEQGGRTEFLRLAELIRDKARLSASLVTRFRAVEGKEDEELEEAVTALREEMAVEEMLRTVEAMPAATLIPTRKSTSAQLTEIWERLSPDSQTMLVTAEYFGVMAPDDADHSGPVLGLAATCERLLYEFLLEDVEDRHPQVLDPEATLGSVIRWLFDARRPTPRYTEGEAIRETLMSDDRYDYELFRSTVEALRRLNVDYRIPAAHRDVVPHLMWVEGRKLVLDPATGLVVRLTQSLRSTSR